MKPKHRVFCLEAQRNKMLFESKEKAERFIKYNGDELLKKRKEGTELRVYKCEVCGGWHITSSKQSEFYDNRVSKVIDSYRTWANSKRNSVDVVISVNSLADKLWEEAIQIGIDTSDNLKRFLSDKFAEMYTRQIDADTIRHILKERLMLLNKTSK